MATTWVSFKQIKVDVAIEQVLQRYGVHLRRIGGELRGTCPLPTHTSRRSRDSFSVSVSRNVWSCRSQSCMQARCGNAGGNILDLVALMERCSVRRRAPASGLERHHSTEESCAGGGSVEPGGTECTVDLDLAAHRPASPVPRGKGA
jgi:hypothetical protein